MGTQSATAPTESNGYGPKRLERNFTIDGIRPVALSTLAFAFADPALSMAS